MLQYYRLEIKNVSKTYPGVKALDDVSLQIKAGEVHGLMGENGAGKSTLMKILIGLADADSGEITVDGRTIKYKNVHGAQQQGLSMIHQELMPWQHLSVSENIFMGRLPVAGRLKLIDRKRMRKEAAALLRKIGSDIDINRLMKDLSVAEMQMVEIAKAISHNARVIIMDEPTSAITDREVEKLFRLIDDLKSQGITIIYISHKMDEVFRICDRISVLRDGKYMGSFDKNAIDIQGLIKLIAGRQLSNVFTRPTKTVGDVALEVQNISGSVFSEINFSVRRGEILGIAGLMGSGRTDIVNAIFGLQSVASGKIMVDGNTAGITSPATAIKKGIGLVSEDRKKYGLVLNQSLAKNITLSAMRSVSKHMLIDNEKESAAVSRQVKRLNIKAAGPWQQAGELSGGNQQKVVLAKVLMNEPEVLILDEPTRGIDIGAKAEIYQLINELASEGRAIILVSSELPEIVGLSDRVLVIHGGRIKAELRDKDINQEKIMQYAMT